MGIDFSHCDAHWAYSGFHRFRSRLAATEGIRLEAMAGFEDHGLWGQKKALPGKPWNGETSPLVPILNHSDCDGEMTYAECQQVAPRIREIIESWPDNDFDKQRALLLVEGMLSVEPSEVFEFF